MQTDQIINLSSISDVKPESLVKKSNIPDEQITTSVSTSINQNSNPLSSQSLSSQNQEHWKNDGYVDNERFYCLSIQSMLDAFSSCIQSSGKYISSLCKKLGEKFDDCDCDCDIDD